jgi:tRNA(adenine34) deaminase
MISTVRTIDRARKSGLSRFCSSETRCARSSAAAKWSAREYDYYRANSFPSTRKNNNTDNNNNERFNRFINTRANSNNNNNNDNSNTKKTKKQSEHEERAMEPATDYRNRSKAEDEHYMSVAIEEARKAMEKGEVPVGAILVHGDYVIARTRNRSQQRDDPLAHAELMCIEEGRKALGNWRRLKESTLYVTLEPCAMCAGAILQARVGNVVYGARNPQLGAHGSWCALLGARDEEEPLANGVNGLKTHAIMPEVNVRADVLREECSDLLKQFWQNRREQRRIEKEKERIENEKYEELIFNFKGSKVSSTTTTSE